MVTTLIEQVAKHLQHHSDPYSLRFLTLEESWELLHKKVFQGESCPPNLLEAGLQVSEHCKGLPLVIVLIAGIIVKMERQASFWLEVANDLSSHALDEQSMKVRQSSYEHLDDHLKPCLLYMGLFPEDYKIPVSALLKLWMAEEFVVNVDTENYMEEAGRVCLNDLLNRSLIIVNIRNFFLLLENEEEESSETLLENLKTFRNLRVYVNGRNPRLWWRFPNLEELGLSLGSLPSRSLFPISEVHTRLQSLDLECPHWTYRYSYSVGWESYFVFPSNLRNLWLRNFSIMKELTSNIARLQKLESLKIIRGLLLGKECWDVREVEFQALKYLTLEWIDLREWKASEESFPVLDKLFIKGCYYFKEILPCFVDIPTLQLIELVDCRVSVKDSAMNIKREIEETTGCDTLQLMI
uniref:Late blight resistance protein R1-A-like n=1 Tax=Nicotiana tabacum TaxID=4097 RepID=A0A1S4CK46_TOBAC|nr:PREDICTED: late blight resistance protein R1-A-like [Nicotiana tabacum]